MVTNIDQNSRDVAKGVYFHKGRLIPIPIEINPVTKKLKIEIIPRAIGAINVPSRMPIDANSNQVNGGLSNDADKTIIPISVDNLVGFPLLRIEKI